jgi:hypothetical protein
MRSRLLSRAVSSSGMTTSTGRHQNQAIHARFDSLAGVPQGRDIMEDNTTIEMHGIHNIPHRPQGGNNHRHPMTNYHIQIGLKARIAAMNDQIDPERGILGPKGRRQLVKPVRKSFGRTLVQGRKGP